MGRRFLARLTAAAGRACPAQPARARRRQHLQPLGALHLVLVLVLMLAAAPAAAAPGVITLDERVPAVMLVLTPREHTSDTPTSSLLDAARRYLRVHTRLALLSAEQAGVNTSQLEGCPAAERLGCWLEAVRPDTRDVTSKSAGPRYLFVLAVLPFGEGRERLSLFFTDTEEAIARWRAVAHDGPGWRDRAENGLFEVSKQTAPTEVGLSDRGELEAWLDLIITREVRPTLERNGDWDPYGRVLVHAPEAGLPILVDGTEVGLTTEGSTELREVGPGHRAITLAPPKRGRVTLEVDVVRGESAEVSFAALLSVPDPSARTPSLRPAVLLGGAAVAVAGGVVTALALGAGGGVRQGCVLRPGDGACGSGLGLPTFGWDGDAAPTLDAARINPSGVSMLPLGLALLGVGGATAGGAWLLDDDARGDTWLWLPVVVGVAAGAAIYATGAAMGGR